MVLIASANRELRRHWVAALEPDIRVLEATSRASLEERLSAQPSVLLLHMHLPGLRGLEGVADCRRLSPGTRIILLTSPADEKEEILALKLGIKGYCREDLPSALIARAVRAVAHNEIWIGRRIIPRLLEEIAARGRGPDHAAIPAPAHPFNRLTPREMQVALLVGDGMSNKEISSKLGISESTVKAHLTAIFSDLGIKDRLQLALLVSDRHRTGAN